MARAPETLLGFGFQAKDEGLGDLLNTYKLSLTEINAGFEKALANLSSLATAPSAAKVSKAFASVQAAAEAAAAAGGGSSRSARASTARQRDTVRMAAAIDEATQSYGRMGKASGRAEKKTAGIDKRLIGLTGKFQGLAFYLKKGGADVDDAFAVLDRSFERMIDVPPKLRKQLERLRKERERGGVTARGMAAFALKAGQAVQKSRAQLSRFTGGTRSFFDRIADAIDTVGRYSRATKSAFDATVSGAKWFAKAITKSYKPAEEAAETLAWKMQVMGVDKGAQQKVKEMADAITGDLIKPITLAQKAFGRIPFIRRIFGRKADTNEIVSRLKKVLDEIAEGREKGAGLLRGAAHLGSLRQLEAAAATDAKAAEARAAEEAKKPKKAKKPAAAAPGFGLPDVKNLPEQVRVVFGKIRKIVSDQLIAIRTMAGRRIKVFKAKKALAPTVEGVRTQLGRIRKAIRLAYKGIGDDTKGFLEDVMRPNAEEMVNLAGGKFAQSAMAIKDSFETAFGDIERRKASFDTMLQNNFAGMPKRLRPHILTLSTAMQEEFDKMGASMRTQIGGSMEKMEQQIAESSRAGTNTISRFSRGVRRKLAPATGALSEVGDAISYATVGGTRGAGRPGAATGRGGGRRARGASKAGVPSAAGAAPRSAQGYAVRQAAKGAARSARRERAGSRRKRGAPTDWGDASASLTKGAGDLLSGLGKAAAGLEFALPILSVAATALGVGAAGWGIGKGVQSILDGVSGLAKTVSDIQEGPGINPQKAGDFMDDARVKLIGINGSLLAIQNNTSAMNKSLSEGLRGTLRVDSEEFTKAFVAIIGTREGLAGRVR